MEDISRKFPLLETSRTNLFEIQDSYKNDLFTLFTDPRVTAFFPVITLKEENDILPVIDFFKQNFKKDIAIRWGIKLKENDHLIGTIGYTNYKSGHRASLVYALKPAYWGKGLMREVITEIIRFGFRELDVTRIDAETLLGNTVSEKILEKSGFKFEGLLREWMQWNGVNHDVNMYSLLKKEFETVSD
ncbi:ribosomal-protein-alanine N-acetyltransferase [Pedobacter sp. ok626]|uniref:GNAT family N-acetyltransferase n=1 Tax=Pedobacter sp. ok626 TaxID=1761882 RepID=UPI0008826BE2|nr:GNAT family protein [Pedobacter sp. ok626]SDK56070.1 ribosomal-protein-alanine N-acetyltransferase [Pedobacter sp. ok626]